ncbi:zinc ribbon domain-containing protein [bacterium]|nr:zinc ribbon domain-containing protein [bacterium]
MMELCNYCGYERHEDYKFCPMCGNSFENVCSNCFAIVDLLKFNYCPDCGNQLRDLLLFFSMEEITHPIENKALKDVECKHSEFIKVYKDFAIDDIQMKFN